MGNHTTQARHHTRAPRNMHSHSTAQTTSGVSSGIGGDSQDEGRLEGGGGTRATAARGRRGGGGITHGSNDPAAATATSASASAAHGRVREKSGAGGGRGRGRVGSATMQVWDFERLGRTPLLAAASRTYYYLERHESVLFLGEVSR